jgi:excisionase family DNA binding protein
MQETPENRQKPELSSTAVAREIGVSLPTVRALVERGELGAWRIGKCYKFSRASVDEFLNRNSRPRAA